MRLIDAFRLVKSKRTIVAPNPAFMRQLCHYEVAQQQGWQISRGQGGGDSGIAAQLSPSLDSDKYAANRFGKVRLPVPPSLLLLLLSAAAVELLLLVGFAV